MALTDSARFTLGLDGDWQRRILMASLEYTATVMGETQTIDGTLDISADAGGQKIMTRSRIAGRRLGAC